MYEKTEKWYGILISDASKIIDANDYKFLRAILESSTKTELTKSEIDNLSDEDVFSLQVILDQEIAHTG